MLISKRHLASLAAGTALAFAAASPSQAIINAPVPVQNYITIGGLDWAWANPCAPYGDSCGVVDMTYQSTQGWHFPTLAEFMARPKVSDFGTFDNFACASAWFSVNYTHCDYFDPEYPGGNVNGSGQPMGGLFDYGYGITQYGSNPLSETWVVRGSLPPVPEPASWAMMIGGFGLAGWVMRRRATNVSFA